MMNPYLLSGSLDLSLSGQQTYIATGGTGTGVIRGTESGGSDFFGKTPTSLFVTTPFGSCDLVGSCGGSANPIKYQYSFVFGQPFTLNVTGHLTTGTRFSSSEAAGANVGVSSISDGVFDVAGNPILTATFTLVTIRLSAWR